MNRRKRMYASNLRARNFLLENNHDEIWFKSHTRRKDKVYAQCGTYKATDLWNLFDGVCFDYEGNLVFFQVKTNGWPDRKPIITFLRKWGLGFYILAINVHLTKKHWKVDTRIWFKMGEKIMERTSVL